MDFQSLSEHEKFIGKGRILLARYHQTWQTLTKAEKAVLMVLNLKKKERHVKLVKPEDVITIQKWEFRFFSVSSKNNRWTHYKYLIKSKKLPLSFVKDKGNKDCYGNLDFGISNFSVLNISPLNLMLWQRRYLIYGWALSVTIIFWCVLEYKNDKLQKKNDKLHSTNIIACLLGLRYSARAQEYPAEKDGFAVKQCSLYRRWACQQMVIMQWHNCYQRCVQSVLER